MQHRLPRNWALSKHELDVSTVEYEDLVAKGASLRLTVTPQWGAEVRLVLTEQEVDDLITLMLYYKSLGKGVEHETAQK